jgi:hypothetical protein
MFGEKPTGCELQGKMISDIHCKRVKGLLETCGGTVAFGGKVNLEAKHIEPTIIL